MARSTIWCLFFAFLLTFVVQNGCSSKRGFHNHNRHHRSHSSTWDYLLFSQSWPPTRCMAWQEKSPDNTCAFPKETKLWTVHGVWPSNPGSLGPEDCRPDLRFNLTSIDPILSDMREYWINVDSNTPLDTLWEHEWTKHGTCAISLPQLDSELKYFKQGLDWSKQFNMDMLERAEIIPSDKGYHVKDIYAAAQVLIGKRPMVQCIYDRDSRQSLLSEIRTCFNRRLELVDCDVLEQEHRGNILTNCHLDELVYYLPKPTNLKAIRDAFNQDKVDKYLENKRRLYQFYNIIKLTMLTTL